MSSSAAVLLLALVASVAAGCREQAAPSLPLAATVPAEPVTPRAETPTGLCALCGMEVSEHPDWAGTLELPDGGVRHGCCVRCTLGAARRSAQFLGVDPGKLGRVLVPDYLHPGRQVDSRSAFFVVDSAVRGPMGVDLVAAATEQEARQIVARHGGRVLRSEDVTLDLLLNLRHHGKSRP